MSEVPGYLEEVVGALNAQPDRHAVFTDLVAFGAWNGLIPYGVRDLQTLPDEQRKTIELAYFGGFSHSQIAELLGEPVCTIKGRMRLGLDKMRRQLSEGYAAGGFA